MVASLRREKRSGFGLARPGKSTRHRWLVNLLLISLTGYFWLSSHPALNEVRPDPFPVIAAEPGKAHIQRPAPSSPSADYRVIVERNLFGTPQGSKTPVQQETDPEEVPLAERSVGLKLVGTVVTDDPAKNVAVIDNQRTSKQDLYHEGDRVGRILIKRIVRNNVIISMGAEEQRLAMGLGSGMGNLPLAGRAARNPEATDNPRATYSRLSAQRHRAVQSRQPGSEAGPTDIPARQKEGKAVSIRLVQQEVTSALADTDKAAEAVKIRPYNSKGDKSGGFLIRSVRPGSIFAKIGLRTGDVITGLNEEAVAGVEQAEELYRSLREGGDIALEVKRGIRTRNLQLVVE